MPIPFRLDYVIARLSPAAANRSDSLRSHPEQGVRVGGNSGGSTAESRRSMRAGAALVGAAVAPGTLLGQTEKPTAT